MELEIKKTRNGDEMTVVLVGRLNTVTAPQLEEELEAEIPSLKKLTMDLAGLEYLSSAGLRVLLGTAQEMEDSGDMILKSPTQAVMDVFKVTGFTNAFTIE